MTFVHFLLILERLLKYINIKTNSVFVFVQNVLGQIHVGGDIHNFYVVF